MDYNFTLLLKIINLQKYIKINMKKFLDNLKLLSLVFMTMFSIVTTLKIIIIGV